MNLPALGEELQEIAATFLQDFPSDEYPYLAEHIEYHLTEPSESKEGTSEFEFGLDLILDGIERMRDAGSS